MRNLLNTIIIVVIPIAEFVAIRRIGLPGPFGVFIIVATLLGLLVWAAIQDRRASQLRLQKGAASLGFQPADRNEVSLSIYPLRGDGWVQVAAKGELRGMEAWIFDYTVRDHGDPNMRRDISQTVVAFDVEDANLPIFQIRPLNWSTSILDPNWKNYDGDWENSDETICFPDAFRFHRRFELISSAEEGVRRHFNAQLLNTLATLNDCNWWIKGYYTTVLFFTPNRILRPDEYEALAREGADIAYALFSSERRVTAAAAK